MNLADIPDVDIRPVGAEPSKVRELLRSHTVRRRRILKGIVGAGMVLSIGALDILPGRNKAHASLQGTAPWQFWNHCNDYNNDSDWKICNPAGGASVSQLYCQPANLARHRTDFVEQPGCAYTNYDSDMRCKGVNAWRWYRSNDGDPGGPASVVCSDGWIYYREEITCRDGNFKSTCRHYL